MNVLGVIAVAVGALWGKKGRNLLTMSGVTIGVFALTTIIALGQGLSTMVTDSIANDGNLRQVRLMAGAGVQQQERDEEMEITGEMSEARRLRLRRSALNRRRMRRSSGRRLNVITDASIRELSKLDHVQAIQPLVTERYQLTLDDLASSAAVSFGVDVGRDLYRDRLVAGEYFSSNDAQEVILHEYLLYQWGLVSLEEQKSVIGKRLTLSTIEISALPNAPRQMPPLSDITNDLSEEEQDALKTLLPKLMRQFGKMEADREPTVRELTVVGVLREAETGEAFNFVEDTSSSQADVYLPHGTARELFVASSVNSELGYASALVMVDDPRYASEVEQSLRDRGYTAFSVAGVLQQIDNSLTIVTVVVAFLTGIALLVSTLGIVNTMITSVLERTREIGIYKAVGASDLQVMAMFLTESALIGFGGGLLGLGIAVLAMLPGDAIAAGMIAERAAVSLEGSVFVVPLWLMAGGPLLGLTTAVVAAFIPARRAASIDPVKALRHD